MKAPGIVVAWICISTTLFAGCYSSALVDPTGPEKEKVYSGRIESVLTKDGTHYVFRTAPNIVNGAIVGVIEAAKNPGIMIEDVKQVSIPISDVESISVSEIDAVRTGLGVLVGVGAVVIIYGVIESIQRPGTGLLSGWGK